MKIAIYVGSEHLGSDERFLRLVSDLEAGGCAVYEAEPGKPLEKDTGMLLSVGGDGTFLSAAIIAIENSLPVAGVNMGRMGFLSAGRPEEVSEAILSGEYTIDTSTVLNASIKCPDRETEEVYAFNEMAVRRSGASMLEIDVCVDGVKLPTYWSDGLVISTSSGSTAYSLSVGGPIVLPESRVLIISPIAPHNLNVRPLVVPDTSEIVLSVHSRDGHYEFSSDNRASDVPETTEITVNMARFSLKRVRLKRSNFIQALTDKLFWGEDVRNIR